MITTPLGQINTYVDGVCVEYEAVAHCYDTSPMKGKPIAGCYRIHIHADYCCSIQCEIELNNTSIPNTGASGEKYMDAEFICGSTILTIGAEDENSAFETLRTAHGIEHIIRQPIREVVFGIAWTTDYEGASDVRTWYAADPTLDRV